MTTLIFTLLFVLAVVVGAVVGLIRGLNKSVIRMMTLVVAVILTFVLAGPITTLLAQNIRLEGQTVDEIILSIASKEEMVGEILEAAPLLREAILVAPAFLISFLTFPVLFLLLRFITWIVHLCVQKPLRRVIFKDNGNKAEYAAKPAGVRVGKRFAGMGVGIVAGVLVFGMLLAPVLGLFSMLPSTGVVDESLSAMENQGYLSDASADMVRDAYSVTDSAVVKFYGFIGIRALGRSYINSASRIEANGTTLYLTDEFDSLLSVVQTAVEGGMLNALMNSEDQNAIYTLLSDKTFLDSLMQDMFRSRLLCSAAPEVAAMAMKNVAVGMGVPENKEAVYNNMMDNIADAVKEAQIDYAGIKAYEAAHNVTRSLLPMRVAEQENMNTGLMTQEEYEAEIQKLADLETAISSIINQALSGDNATFTDSVASYIVMEVTNRAAEGGQETLDSFDASAVQTVLSDINATDLNAGEGDAEQLLGQLQDQEKFETDTATVETITEGIRQTMQNALADEEKAAETASTLASVVSGFVGAVVEATDEEGNIDATKLNYEMIANAVTELQNSDLKGVGSSMIDMVASGDLGGNSMIGDVLGAVKEGYENGENVSGAINSAGALVNLGAAMNGSGESNETMVNSLTSLINNLDEFTIRLLPNIMTDDTIVSMGVPSQYARETYNVIETLLKELMALKGAQDYDNEVNAILSLYNLATSGMENFTTDDISELADYAVDSDAIFNTLKSVSTSNPFGIDIQNEADRADLVQAIEDGYAKSGQTQREKDVYNAIAMVLGIDEDVNLG